MRVRDLEGWGGELVELAWELNDLGFDSVVRLAPGRRPSVEIFVPPGARVTTTQRGRTSVFTWDRHHSRPSRNLWGRDQRGRDQPGRSRMREAAERLMEVAR
ncbi:hypothetical protein SAMN05216275_12489 [Streptosporangium canum]|uniref:Uncharacterized protein n=1 Tax=Streptosporangium canum TaxID=324952 RepID=A0A1I3ZA46_9ACTN|nr:hypothetical protein [Streptosporangium canum]SFK40937.1 hypothetical protein SAMN05216275_12489 [Streptosporangium canum]